MAQHLATKLHLHEASPLLPKSFAGDKREGEGGVAHFQLDHAQPEDDLPRRMKLRHDARERIILASIWAMVLLTMGAGYSVFRLRTGGLVSKLAPPSELQQIPKIRW